MLAGDPRRIAVMLAAPGYGWPLACCGAIVTGCAIYGFTLGLWRDATQSLFTAIKFPLLIFLTCGGNALLNGCLAQLLGTNLSFRQTTLAILMSFTIVALILASFAPVMLFLLWNTPPLADSRSLSGHSVTLLAHVALIAFAGLAGNHRLFLLLRHVSGNRRAAWATLLSWLCGNLLLGSQISWILRPFIGSPGLPVQFLRADPLRGNFFEAVWSSLHRLLT